MNVLFAARLVPFKDPITFVKAAKLRPQDQFVLAGDGSLKTECLTIAPSNLSILGWVNQQEALALIRDCDVFCQLSPTENIWSASLIQAMKNGKAIVCTDAGYTRTYLQDRVHALLIKPHKEVELALALADLENKSFRERLGENAYKFVAENLSFEKISSEISNLIYEMVNEK